MLLPREAVAKMEASSSMDFAFLCTCLEKLEKNSHATGRRTISLQLLHRLLEAARSHGDLYGVVRLLIPKRDVERQHYNMKENALAVVLMQALGIGADSKDGMLLSNWKHTSNHAAGDFTGIAMQVISRRRGLIASSLSVTDINSMLDRLAKTSKRKARVDLLKELLGKSTTVEIKWFIRIIFKDMKIGLGENTILDTLHEDARAMMAICVDLKRVCSQLHDHNSHPFRKELTLGKVLKCQHSKRMNSVEAAWLAMKRSEVVAECKFDGDRMQVHRDGSKIWFWSRNGKEHPEYMIPLEEALCRCLSSERCVLDGELLVWDVEDCGFKARTKALNHDAAREARKGVSTNHQICYVIFDILYEESFGSLIHLPLKKRREILKQVVHPHLSSQIFSTITEGSEWTITPTCLEELKSFFWQMVEKGNEGIVVKSLGSHWTPDNRDGRWCKIKPDYVFVGSDLDLIIIGGYFGTGSRGGKIASFLLALVDECGDSTRFLSICRCGQGLSEEEFSFLESKLSPYIIKNEKGKPPPACGYLVTNSRYECPDVWISRPEMSIVLQVSSEKRVYPTQSFKAGWTFRFPRIIKVRYDKCWKEALHVQEFEEIIRAAKEHGNSMLHGPQRFNQLCQSIQTRKRKQVKKHQAVLPHLQNLDVSHVEQVDSFFEGLIFYICSSENSQEKETLHIQIKRSGGRMVPNFVQSVTHIIACEAKGFQFQVAVDNNRDVICHSWVSACIEAKKLLPFSPRHYLFQGPITREKLQMVIDSYGDPWFEDATAQDLLQVLKSISSKDLLPFAGKRLSFKSKGRKLGEEWCWSLFEGCHFYFHKPLHSVNPDSQMLAIMTLNRLQLGAEMLGASTSSDFLSNTTHVVIYVPSKSSIPTKRILRSFNHSEKLLLQSPFIDIVSHSWLEDCMRKREALCIRPYLFSKGYDAFVPNRSEATIKEPVNSISSEDCVASNSNYQLVKRKQCLDVAALDRICDGEKKKACRTVGSTHQATKKKQHSSVAEEDSDCDIQRKRPRKRYMASPKCSFWSGSFKEGKLESLECVATVEDNAKRDSCCQENIDIATAIQQDACVVSAMLADGTRLQCDSKITMSEVIWESECLQDIAQVYLGSFCEESTLSVTDYLLNRASESQAPPSILEQDKAKAKEFLSPTCIPKRRFTCRGLL